MERGPIVVSVFLALMASIALAPTAGLAGQVHDGRSVTRPVVHGPVGGHPFVSRPFAAHPFSPRPFFPRHFSRPFVRFGVIGSPVVVYAPPLFYGSPAYYDQSGYYNPQPVYYPSSGVYNPRVAGTVSLAPPPPTPSVIEYPTGRYELRGDGVATPYTWVWIPNPPPRPPPAAPSAGAPASGDPSPARPSRLYRWTDGQGVVHFEERRDLVPQQ